MSIDNLIKQLENYTEKDLCITGNPQVTFNVSVHKKFSRHTNFTYGNISQIPSIITDNSITWNCLEDNGDIINNIIFFVENIDNLANITLSLDDYEPIVLSSEYLKIYNLLCKKIIFETTSGFIISFNPANLFIFLPDGEHIDKQLFRYYTGLPTISSKLTKINWICIGGKNLKNAVLNINFVILDLEERRRFADITVGRKLFAMESYEIYKNKLSCWNLTQNKTIPIYFIGCLLSDLDYESLESIEITFNNLTIKITKSVIELFDKFYVKILFDYNGYKIIKIKFLSIFNIINNPEEYYLKINFVNNYLPSNNKIYQFQNIDELDRSNYLIICNGESPNIFTNGYYEYVNNLDKISNLTNSNYQCGLISISNEQINLTHIKEIFIFFTNIETNKKEKIANKFKITIADITNEYSSLQMDIYSNLHHANIDDQIYNIGYSLNPSHSYPNGNFNIAEKPIKIEYVLSENINLSKYKINVVFFGFNVL